MCGNKDNYTYYMSWCPTIICYVPSEVKLPCCDAGTNNIMTITKTMDE